MYVYVDPLTALLFNRSKINLAVRWVILGYIPLLYVVVKCKKARTQSSNCLHLFFRPSSYGGAIKYVRPVMSYILVARGFPESKLSQL